MWSSGQQYQFNSLFDNVIPQSSSSPLATQSTLSVRSSPTSSFGLNDAGAAMSIMGAISGAIGSFYSAKQQQDSLKFQSEISAINARAAENQAQSIMESGQRAIGQLTLKAGKVKGAQKASMAANGIVLGEGNSAEVVASTDTAKEIDSLTINSNATRAAWAARTQAVNLSNQSLLQGTTAASISPVSSGATSMMTGVGQVASSWVRDKKLEALLGAQ